MMPKQVPTPAPAHTSVDQRASGIDDKPLSGAVEVIGTRSKAIEAGEVYIINRIALVRTSGRPRYWRLDTFICYMLQLK